MGFDYLSVFEKLSACKNVSQETLKTGQSYGDRKGHSDCVFFIQKGGAFVLRPDLNGKECVIDLVASGHIVIDPLALNGGPGCLRIEAVTPSVICSLGPDMMQESLHKDDTIKNDLIRILAQQNHALIRHFERVHLHTPLERLGSYLVDLKLDIPASNSAEITLPFSKHVIASYLGMTPETLSRCLQLLKEEGFMIAKRSLTLPEPKSLCAYCDTEQAAACPDHFAPHCPHSRLL